MCRMRTERRYSGLSLKKEAHPGMQRVEAMRARLHPGSYVRHGSVSQSNAGWPLSCTSLIPYGSTVLFFLLYMPLFTYLRFGCTVASTADVSEAGAAGCTGASMSADSRGEACRGVMSRRVLSLVASTPVYCRPSLRVT